MNSQGANRLGLVVLYEGETPDVDVVAVHGLGADPAWAWVRKVGVEGTDQYKKVNWLADKDLLPAKIPHARIMTFNHESKWHKDAPKQRRDLDADQLLTAIDNRRKEEKETKHRPLISIGHGFGGIVIEQVSTHFLFPYNLYMNGMSVIYHQGECGYLCSAGLH